jgi:hypothetical protein
MSESKEVLRSMLANFINDKDAEATLDFSNYVTAKMKDVAGLAPATQVENDVTNVDNDNE